MSRNCCYYTGPKFGDIKGEVIGMNHEHTVIEDIKTPVTLYKVKDQNGDIHRGVIMGHNYQYPTLGEIVEMQLEQDEAFMTTLDQGKMVKWFSIEKMMQGRMLNDGGK